MLLAECRGGAFALSDPNKQALLAPHAVRRFRGVSRLFGLIKASFACALIALAILAALAALSYPKKESVSFRPTPQGVSATTVA